MGDSHPPVYWEVAGGAAAGYINANDVFRPSSSNPLPRDNYVTVHARTYDGRDAYAFVAAPYILPRLSSECGVRINSSPP